MRNWTPVKNHPNIYEYQTAKGKRYGVRRGFKNSLGKADEFTKSGLKTWRDADIILKRFEADLATGNIGAITSQKVTVDQYWQRMSSRKIKLKIWKESTRKNSTNFYKGYLKPVFGNTYLSDVTRSSFQSFLDGLAIKNLAKSTIRTITSVMLAIMNNAEYEDVIPKNKLKGMLIQGRAAKDLTIQTTDYEKWIDTAENILDKYMLSLVYIGCLGERRGELMGLRTSSFKFETDKNTGEERCAIKIDLQRTADELNGTTLKTQSSYRTLWVTGEIIKNIRYAITTSDNIRERNNINANDHWLWLNEKGSPLHPYYANKLTKRINDASDMQITPHMLRHYFATKGMASTSADIEVMHWLGHRNLQMTADYTRPTAFESLELYSNVGKDLHDFDGTKHK
ncbi:tyrosine recombinase XerC [Lapidilactobacillus mulanensis]|uniref:Tyrosine recombinase XerC n=1 Tax=Lapidilactobacillus mulanensis TaxID=2485999 RepID=A0ABW4DPE6_9LACO|nr:site-specific integrase [Lapidilactobacillus mulanensis]